MLIEEPTNIINPINDDDDLDDEREIFLGDSDIILVIIKCLLMSKCNSKED
jgi:hypothetical protein